MKNVKKKLLLLIIGSVFMLGVSGCEKKPHDSVNFSDKEIKLGDSKSQLEKNFKNFTYQDSDDKDTITLYNKKQGELLVSFADNKVAYIQADKENKGIDYNGATIGASIKETSKALRVDEDFLGNNSVSQIFYDTEGDVVYKTKKETYSFVGDDVSDTTHSNHKIAFFKNYSKIKNSKYLIEVEIWHGKLYSFDILSSSVYLRSCNIDNLFFNIEDEFDVNNTILAIDDKIENNYMFKELLSDNEPLPGKVYIDKDDEEDKEDGDWNHYSVRDETYTKLASIDVSKKDNLIDIYSEEPGAIINNIYVGENKEDVIKTLDVSKEIIQKNNDIGLSYNSDKKIIKHYDDAQAFLNSTELLPASTKYFFRIIFDDEKVSGLSLVKY